MMSALRYRNRLRRLWWLLMLCALAGLIGGFIGGMRLFPVFTATAWLQADIRVPTATADVTLANNLVVRTLALDATSQSVLQAVAAKYLNLSESRIASEVSSLPVANSSLLAITVQDASPTLAASLANNIADEVISRWQTILEQQNAASQQPYLVELAATSAQLAADTAARNALGTPPSDLSKAALLQAQISTLQQQYQQQALTLSRIQVAEAAQTFQLSVAQRATPPASPLLSRLAVDSAAGGIFGLFVGLALVAALGRTRRRLRSVNAVADLSGWPVLFEFARAMRTRTTPRGTPAAVDSLGTAASALTQAIDFLSIDQPLRVIVLTSPSGSGAASALATALALYISSAGRRTLLVDARLANGWQARQFGVPLVPGLSDALLDAKSARGGSFTLDSYLQEPTRLHTPLLRVLSAGSVPPNSNRLLASRPFAAVLSALVATQAEMIVIDAPPLLDMAQASAFTGVADGVLPVVDLDDTSIERLQRLQASLAEAGASVLGCVVTVPVQQHGDRVLQVTEHADLLDGSGANAIAHASLRAAAGTTLDSSGTPPLGTPPESPRYPANSGRHGSRARAKGSRR